MKKEIRETAKEIQNISDRVVRMINPLEKNAELRGNVFKNFSEPFHPDRRKLTPGQRAADWITRWAGSWIFILIFFVFLGLWMATSGYFVLKFIKSGTFTDNYPFILLNLILSCLAAIQAPVILMSQNRAAERDRLRAEYDYRVNRKAEKEIRELKTQLEKIEKILKR